MASNQIEIAIREICVFRILLTEMNFFPQSFGSVMRVTHARRCHIDRIDLSIGEVIGIRYTGVTNRSAHVEQMFWPEVWEACRQLGASRNAQVVIVGPGLAHEI